MRNMSGLSATEKGAKIDDAGSFEASQKKYSGYTNAPTDEQPFGIDSVSFVGSTENDYDNSTCDFVPWNDITGDIKSRLPESFYDKLIEAVANFDPESEFVTVTAGDGQITIELFKSIGTMPLQSFFSSKFVEDVRNC